MTPPLALTILVLMNAGLLVALHRKLRHHARLSVAATLGVLLVGSVGGAACFFAEREFWRLTELSLEVQHGSTTTALLAMFAFAAPLEEAAKAAQIWPLHRQRKLQTRGAGIYFAVCAGAAVGFGEASASLVFHDSAPLSALRWFLTTPVQWFCAGIWGYVLASPHQGKRFPRAWLAAVALHGFYDHIVFGRGPGLLVLSVPLLIAMVFISLSVLRRASREAEVDALAFVARLPDPGIEAVSQVFRRSAKSLMVHWIALGALVTLGTLIAGIALAVYVGHELGIDFTAADEGDIRANAPLALLAVAVLLAFPLSGYLVAKAGATRGVLEPAMGAALAIVVLALALSLAAPVTAIFVVAVAPIAFGLACTGAWFGLAR